MVEHTLGERFRDRQVRLDREHRRPYPLLLAEHLSAPRVQAAVDTTDGAFRALDLDCMEARSINKRNDISGTSRTKVDGLLECRLGQETRRVQNTTSGRDELSSSTMDGIGMQLT
jgi:hypothetical protein